MSDLHEIMARDPRSYSEQDLDALIQTLRERRNQYNLGNAKAGSTKKPTPKTEATMSLAKSLETKIDL
jgi:hypothetical protein